MRENAQDKGKRYLVEGRLVVTRIARQEVTATCRGDGARYDLGWTARSGWWCSCPAKGRCSHLFALGAVVAVDLPA